ncbi:MAG: response regulator [Candidatus Omnitrophota bacterium]
MAKKRILLIDDEDAFLDMVKMRLEANDYEVITANDGEAGLELARKERPDLIILDLMLPKMDGYRVCALLKKDTRYSSIPILMFTAKAQQEDMKIGEEAGANGYITKPFEPKTLLGKIHEFLKE